MDLRKQPDACSASKKKRKRPRLPLQLAGIRNQSPFITADASGRNTSAMN